jgi:hypothetical protein
MHTPRTNIVAARTQAVSARNRTQCSSSRQEKHALMVDTYRTGVDISNSVNQYIRYNICGFTADEGFINVARSFRYPLETCSK